MKANMAARPSSAAASPGGTRAAPPAPAPANAARRARAAAAALLAAALLAPALSGCRERGPAIRAVYPPIAAEGEAIAILGSSFGAERGDSYVTIAGARPTGSAYLEWTDGAIRLRAPDFGDAGLVFVHVGGRRSNGALLASRASIPRQARDGRAGLAPAIYSVSPREAAVGSLVTITGSGFGNSRGSGGVFFTRAGGEGSGPWGADGGMIGASECPFGYEMWSDREIRARVPDGAASGRIEARTARGRSPPALFEVAQGPGSREFADRRSFVVSYSVNVRVGSAGSPNSLRLWVPSPAPSASQRNAEMLFSSPAPFGAYMGASLFRLDNLEPGSGADASLSWAVDVYGVRSSVRPQDVRSRPSPMREALTAGCALVPAGDPRVRALAASIVGAEQNPYLRARRVYEWMLESIEWEQRAQGDVFSAIEARRADPFLGALLYAALLRAAGVPAQPVAGVIVGRERQTASHHWAEFWIDGLGWLPADPAMGAGAVPEGFGPGAGGHGEALWGGSPAGGAPEGGAHGGGAGGEPLGAAEFFFGNADSMRIAFSRGVSEIPRTDPRGRAVAHERSFALQTLWEEAVGGLDEYSSLWGSVIVTGMHGQ